MVDVLFEIGPKIIQEENIDGYKRITGEFWTARQRQMHSIHYAVSYRASFKPELPNYFINRYCSDYKNDMVLDPFGGRGTTILEANILGFSGYSNDVNPLSERIARPKCRPVTLEEASKHLDRIDFNADVDISDYSDFSPFYHIDTYREMLALKEYLKKNRSDADCFIEMIALSRLHGHSRGFFSVYSFPQISILSAAQARINEQRNQTPEYRQVKPLIYQKAKRVLKDFTGEEIVKLNETAARNIFTCEDSRNMASIPQDSVTLIVTSPPFLNKADYIQDNRLEFWFLGIDPEPLKEKVVQTKNLDEWIEFMRDSIREMYRVLRTGGVAVIEVGDVKHKGHTINLDEVIVELGKEAGFSVVEVLINFQQFTKLANCFNVDNMSKGTNTNRLVIIRKD
ncbi:MAG: DNA methyltransferase [Armatimonadota bacterium]